ncbi:hypothetical protein EK21DRAFT_90855 [Setomelanomma holmii]|uniref:Uncharacterized protein n=1 Tax=Setomelanomma holmii TaxID=210430 RepID=A0A9P4LKZ7_9PLEO|nr:hypothetical protein EK21DRAFT_90855 [Setomelanomma holmii]
MLTQIVSKLRNRIYQFLAYAPASRVCLRPPHRLLNAWGLPSPAQTSDWSKLSRRSLGLTQASQQLRSEFLLVYRTTFHADVDLRDIEEYLQDHIMPGVQHDEDTTGTISITTTSTSYCKVDVLNILLLAAAAPGLDIRLKCLNVSEDDKELVPCKGSAWHAYLLECVQSVIFELEESENKCPCCVDDGDQVTFVIYEKFEAKWMDAQKNVLHGGRLAGMETWLGDSSPESP